MEGSSSPDVNEGNSQQPTPPLPVEIKKRKGIMSWVRALGSGKKKVTKMPTSMFVSEEEMELLSCPVCFEIPMGQVLSCKNGHSHCADCANLLKNCAICREDFTQKIRNIAMEGVLNLKRFQCPYQKDGCTKDPMTRQDLIVHRLKCEFMPKESKLCCLLTRFCDVNARTCTCSFTFSPDLLLKDISEANRLINHIVKSHRSNIVEVKLLEFPSMKFWTTLESPPTGPDHFYNFVIRVTRGNGDTRTLAIYLFLFRLELKSILGMKTEYLSHVCIRLTPPPTLPSGTKEHYWTGDRLQLGVEERGEGLLCWYEKALSLQELEKRLKMEPEKRAWFQYCRPMSIMRKDYMTARNTTNGEAEAETAANDVLWFFVNFNPPPLTVYLPFFQMWDPKIQPIVM